MVVGVRYVLRVACCVIVDVWFVVCCMLMFVVVWGCMLLFVVGG